MGRAGVFKFFQLIFGKRGQAVSMLDPPSGVVADFCRDVACNVSKMKTA